MGERENHEEKLQIFFTFLNLQVYSLRVVTNLYSLLYLQGLLHYLFHGNTQ